MEYKEGDVVLCTVEKIVETTVFVKIENNGEGSITFSEIAPGRIRNIRDYVYPKKKIVCKILRIGPSKTINLSLRRVTSKEKKEVMENYEKEKVALNIIKKIVGEKSERIIDKIKEENQNLYEFLQKSKNDSKILQNYFNEEEANSILKILIEKKEKLKEIKKEFCLKCKQSDGIERIKKILIPYNENISYLGSGKFKISKKASDYKLAEKEIEKILKEIEEKAKMEKCEFEI